MKKKWKQEISTFFAHGKPWYKKWWIWLIAIVLVLIPFLINYAYMLGLELKKPNTAFSASDLLSFYGSILSLSGSIVLGIVTIIINNRATELNKRLMEEQQQAQLPELCIDEKVECYASITDAEFDMSANYGGDICFCMQSEFSTKRQVGYVCLPIKNVSQFPVFGIKALRCTLNKLGEKEFYKLYRMYEQTTTLEVSETKKISVKLIDDINLLEKYYKDILQATILFECYNVQKRRCEFKVTCLIEESKNRCQILETRLKVKYKKEDVPNDNSQR